MADRVLIVNADDFGRSTGVNRGVIQIGVAYGSDIDSVTDLLLQIAREQPEILADPEPKAFFLSHGDSSLNFELRVFVPDPAAKTPLLHRLNRDTAVALALPAEQITASQLIDVGFALLDAVRLFRRRRRRIFRALVGLPLKAGQPRQPNGIGVGVHVAA